MWWLESGTMHEPTYTHTYTHSHIYTYYYYMEYPELLLDRTGLAIISHRSNSTTTSSRTSDSRW